MSQNPYLVKPLFNKRKNMIKIPCDPVNTYMRSNIYDRFNFFQACFNVFDWAKINNKGKFTLHTMYGASPMLWQPDKSCGWDDLGDIRMGKREGEPCNGKANMSFCHDELFDSCFEILMNWDGRGKLKLDATGQKIVNDMIAVLGQNLTYGYILTLLMGQYFDINSPDVNFNDSVTGENMNAFKKTIGTCRGIFDLARSMGATVKYQHMDRKGVLSCNDFTNGCYNKSIEKLWDNMKGGAPEDLRCLVDEGGIPQDAFGGGNEPMWVVSNSIYKKVLQEWIQQCNNIYCTNPRLTREAKTANGITMNVYYMDGVPIIPLKYANYYDKHLTGTLHFSFLTVSRCMTLGGSFGTLPNMNNNTIAMAIQKETNVKDYGKIYMLSQALFYAGFADYDFFTGTQLWCVPE